MVEREKGLTAQADGAAELEDPEPLDRATALGRALLTQDEDLLAEGVRRRRIGEPFAGIIYAHQLRCAQLMILGQQLAPLPALAQSPGQRPAACTALLGHELLHGLNVLDRDRSPTNH